MSGPKTECATGKVCYGRNEAYRKKHDMKLSPSLKDKPRRVYFCGECRQWHITSKYDNSKNSKHGKENDSSNIKAPAKRVGGLHQTGSK